MVHMYTYIHMKMSELKSLIKEVLAENAQLPTLYNTGLKSGEKPLGKDVMIHVNKVREGITSIVKLSFENKISDEHLVLIINEVKEGLRDLESSRGKNRPVRSTHGSV